MKVPVSDGLQVAPVNPGAYVDYAAPGAADKETKLWVDAADRAGGFGIAVGASEYSKALKQADDLQFNMLVAEAEDVQRRLTYDKNEGYLNKRGENAMPDQDGVSLTEKYRDTRKRAVDAIAAKAKNDRVRRRFQKWDLDAGSKFDDMTARHTYDQFVQLQGKVFDQRLEAASTDAVTMAKGGDLVGALVKLDEVKQIADEVGAAMGTKPDYQKLVGPAFAAIMEAAMDANADPKTVKSLYRNNETLLDAKTRDTVGDTVKKWSTDREAADIAEGIFAKHRDEASGLKAALAFQTDDKDLKDSVIQKTGGLFRRDKEVREAGYRQAREAIDLRIARNPSYIPSQYEARGCSPGDQAMFARQRMQEAKRRQAEAERRIESGDSIVRVGVDKNGKGGQDIVFPKKAKKILRDELLSLAKSNPVLLLSLRHDSAIPAGLLGAETGAKIEDVLDPYVMYEIQKSQRELAAKGEAGIRATAGFKAMDDEARKRFRGSLDKDQLEHAASTAVLVLEDADRIAVRDGKPPPSQNPEERKKILDNLQTTVLTKDPWFGMFGGASRQTWEVLYDKTLSADDKGKQNLEYAAFDRSRANKARIARQAYTNFAAIRDSFAPPGSPEALAVAYVQEKIRKNPGDAAKVLNSLTDDQKEFLYSAGDVLRMPKAKREALTKELAKKHRKEFPNDKTAYSPSDRELALAWVEGAFNPKPKPAKTGPKPKPAPRAASPEDDDEINAKLFEMD